MQATFIRSPSGTPTWLTPGQAATFFLLRRLIARKRSFTIALIARETTTSRGRAYMRISRLRSLGLVGAKSLRRGRNGRTFAWLPKCSGPYDLKVITKKPHFSEKAERGYFRWWASINGRIRPKSQRFESAGDILAWLASELAARNLS